MRAPLSLGAPTCVALSRRRAQFFESIREDARAFVDIVNFAMRGLRAPAIACSGEGIFLARTLKQRTAVPRSNGLRRLVFVALSVMGGVVSTLVLPAAQAAAPYPLLGREAPDFALHALVGSNVRLSEHRGEVV